MSSISSYVLTVASFPLCTTDKTAFFQGNLGMRQLNVTHVLLIGHLKGIYYKYKINRLSFYTENKT